MLRASRIRPRGQHPLNLVVEVVLCLLPGVVEAVRRVGGQHRGLGMVRSSVVELLHLVPEPVYGDPLHRRPLPLRPWPHVQPVAPFGEAEEELVSGVEVEEVELHDDAVVVASGVCS